MVILDYFCLFFVDQTDDIGNVLVEDNEGDDPQWCMGVDAWNIRVEDIGTDQQCGQSDE
jgi:hypothetical protein